MESSCHQANFPSVLCHYIQHMIIFKLPCARVELTPKYQTAKFAIVVDTWKSQRGINACQYHTLHVIPMALHTSRKLLTS